jgi:hypothetical protein
MAGAVPFEFATQMTADLDGRNCPGCGQPAEKVLIDAVATAKPTEKVSAFGMVRVDVRAAPVVFTFQPCGCRVTPDDEPIPHEMPC